MFALIKLVANSPGMSINYQSIGSDLGTTRQTISNMFEYLSDTFLVKIIHNFYKKSVN